MDKLEKFWREASAGCEVCKETGATKNMVLNAIINGARDLETLKAEVPLCAEGKCTAKNPSGKGCSENTEALLSIYAPIYEFMKEGHSHEKNKKHSDCSKDISGGCGSCNSCG
ncbi:MAG: hypothetical protein PHO18_03860 [Synergistaceae bacterium]|nr:hypothetical protein [Synergistaceae bacterium]